MERLFEIDLKDYKETDEVFRRPSARAIILQENKIALVYSKKEKYYKFPGGGIHDDENKIEALIREVREEVGMIVIPESIREFGSVLRRQKSDESENNVFEQENYYYFCTVENQLASQELDDYEKEAEFVLRVVDIGTAIRANREYHSENFFDEIMIKRELRVLQMIQQKMKFRNVYFVIGNAYAGKSTLVKNLVEKYQGIALEENYHDQKLPELDSKEFPNLTYTRDLQDWHEFIRRTPEEYARWINDVAKECEIIELQILEELLNDQDARNKKIFVDTNISIETLRKISDKDHVIVMLADPQISVRRFFDRPDPEKQFLYQLMLEEPDPQAALDNYREILTRINSKENYEKFEKSGFQVIYRDEERSQEETMGLAEKLLELEGGKLICS